MAKPRQPTDLLLVKGKKHLTKAEIEDRKSKEVKAPSDKVKAPSYLPADLKKEFNKIAKELKEIGIITNLDIDALARFIIAKKMYLELTKQILEKPELMIVDKDIVTTQDKLFKQCRVSASDLGLTISSRCKLVVPKKEDKKELTEEEKLFGGKV
ncbi:phage terminase small subunit P27 family [Clostridium botulinum]|uniref:phage terminase small subunit P27 family n=1 Tax=Clostridium botulinum TaxID=1491 RepID=UPI0001591F51|nr:phage terminase small subunit P27 family [Clostridium botulinum]ABS32344.1 phage terminase, small subunit, P27 family [Clostridium botulinum A str. ATCC 19397]MBO3438453.1 phage terminase small subunit P27 family [Clostridium botulinum]MBY6952216.1 phage terminase small subunit P27 family [Clostridium botulinum]NFH87843.1 phage terminase small subunit P27 family [Clostridium botulinum]NFJ77462.1 phage terminase small subunit P27 family [Clostridium botulinum]